MARSRRPREMGESKPVLPVPQAFRAVTATSKQFSAISPLAMRQWATSSSLDSRGGSEVSN